MNDDNPSRRSIAEIDISCLAGQWPQDLESALSHAVECTLRTVAPKAHGLEISLVLADNAMVQELNRRYRSKDKPTNVLSFPGQQLDPHNLEDLNDVHLGDVILAHETVAEESVRDEKSFQAHAIHLVVHGVLHLLGHDHVEEDEATFMENLEVKILQNLGINNPYIHVEDR